MRIATLFSTWSTDRLEAADMAEDLHEIAHECPEPSGLETSRPRARRGYGLLKGRRTRFQAKRRTGKLTPDTAVHRDEREIIARN